MKWEDTVLSGDRMSACYEIDANKELSGNEWGEARRAIDLEIAKAQAEASFKAGIREVVEWVEDNKFSLRAMDNYHDFGVDRYKWLAKLKEWGI